MIRKLLATTAIATLVATGGAYAQTAPTEPTMPAQEAAPQVIHAEGHLASNVIGQSVYSSTTDDAENIGSISDIVLSPEGDVQAVVIGVGGFLGIGKKDVAIEYDLVQWTERDGNRYVVVETTREALEALPTFDVAAYRPMPADAQIGNTTPATGQEIGAAPATPPAATAPTDSANDATQAPADDTAADDMAADDTATDDMAQAPAGETAPGVTTTDDTETSAIDRSAMTEVPVADVSADALIGTTVYGAGDENVGSIADVILSTDGQVDVVTVDVGGFLGIGAKQVAIDLDNLAFMRDGDGKLHLYTALTKEQLEAQPEYDPATFADNRDQQLLVIPR